MKMRNYQRLMHHIFKELVLLLNSLMIESIHLLYVEVSMDTYAAKSDPPPLHVSLNSSAAIPSFKKSVCPSDILVLHHSLTPMSSDTDHVTLIYHRGGNDVIAWIKPFLFHAECISNPS